MRDIIGRLLIAAGLLAGTTCLPTLSEAVSTRDAGIGATPARICPTKPAGSGTRALACIA